MKGFIRHLALAVLLTAACESPGATEMASFLSDSTVRLELEGEKVFTYDESTCQLAYNEKRCEFRAHTDTMLDYFVLTLTSVPSTKGSRTGARIAWSTQFGEKTKENITLEAVRISGDVIWLCDESSRNAVVIRTLE